MNQFYTHQAAKWVAFQAVNNRKLVFMFSVLERCALLFFLPPS